EWINDKHERFLDCSVLLWLKIGDFPAKDKARNAFICMHNTLCVAKLQNLIHSTIQSFSKNFPDNLRS
ncbi:MAG: hypothetical protein J1E84_04440, partial [Muribaculaceae bacterium]|nr:hypothetical protein [Muribaculaceae bacterium]